MNRRATDQELKGMTVNERLFACNLAGDFESAARTGNKRRMIEILEGVALTNDQASSTTQAILKNPKKYGY